MTREKNDCVYHMEITRLKLNNFPYNEVHLSHKWYDNGPPYLKN